MPEDVVFTEKPQIMQVIDEILAETIDPVYQNIYLVNGDKKERYNEDLYSMIIDIHREYKKDSYNDNKEIVDAYRRYVAEVQGLMDSLRIKDELVTALLFSELLSGGFFSYRHQFYGANNRDFLPLFLGTSVVLGQGTCRHIGDFYKDVFSGLYNHPLSYSGTLAEIGEVIPTSNHTINLINYHDKMYGYDVGNDAMFVFNSPYEMEPVGEPTYRFKYRSLWEILHSDYYLNEVEENFKLFSQSVGSLITMEEHDNSLDIALWILEEKDSLLKSFDRHTAKQKRLIKERIEGKYGKFVKID